jgi:hypothetical protein
LRRSRVGSSGRRCRPSGWQRRVRALAEPTFGSERQASLPDRVGPRVGTGRRHRSRRRSSCRRRKVGPRAAGAALVTSWLRDDGLRVVGARPVVTSPTASALGSAPGWVSGSAAGRRSPTCTMLAALGPRSRRWSSAGASATVIGLASRSRPSGRGSDCRSRSRSGAERSARRQGPSGPRPERALTGRDPGLRAATRSLLQPHRVAFGLLADRIATLAAPLSGGAAGGYPDDGSRAVIGVVASTAAAFGSSPPCGARDGGLRVGVQSASPMGTASGLWSAAGYRGARTFGSALRPSRGWRWFSDRLRGRPHGLSRSSDHGRRVLE